MKEHNQSKEDRLLLAQLEDKREQAESRYMVTAGDFLDAHQRKLAEEYFRGAAGSVRPVFYGGYDEAERCMPVFLPDYVTDEMMEEELGELLRVVRVRAPGTAGKSGAANKAGTASKSGALTGFGETGSHGEGKSGAADNAGATAKAGSAAARPSLARELTHRDYLGSLLALGIERDVTGDILVRGRDSALGPGADIIVEAEIADFIEANYDKAGRTNLEVEALPIDQLYIEPVRMEERRDTVASLRLDSIVASAFRLSRANAGESIRKGMVSVNSVEVLKVDAIIEEGDRIVLRGRGKVMLAEVGGVTRKDRICITLQVYR